MRSAYLEGVRNTLEGMEVEVDRYIDSTDHIQLTLSFENTGALVVLPVQIEADEAYALSNA
jgi:hypothetical protein